MSYSPLGHLGAPASQFASLSDAEVRREAERIGTRIFQHYDRVKRLAAPLMRNVQWSDEAYVEGAQLLRRITRQRVSIPIPTRAYAAVMKREVARMGIVAAKAKQMVYSRDPRFWLPTLVRMAEAQGRMAAQMELMGSQVRASNASSGLGLWPLVWAAGYVLVAYTIVDSFLGASRELDEVQAYVESSCESYTRQTGQPCLMEQRQQFAEEARQVQRETGLSNRAINAIERGTDNLTQAGGLVDRLGTAGIVAIGAGALVLTGLGVYAIWPYLATVRGAGKRVQRRVEA
jgi:hypothetical protein